MPREITLDDGTKQTVYDESEVQEFKTAAEKAKEMQAGFKNLRKEMGIGDNDSITNALKDMKEQANPNFGKYKAKFKAMEAELKKGGKEFDDDGNPIKGQKAVSMEDIEKMVGEATSKALSSQQRNTLFSRLSDEDRKTVEPIFDKLQSLGGDMKENLDLAMSKAFPDRSADQIKETFNFAGGNGPIIKNDKGDKPFSETDAGKSLLTQIVGTPKKEDKE